MSAGCGSGLVRRRARHARHRRTACHRREEAGFYNWPAFNESYYGYSTFSELLEEAAKNKVVTLERDEKSGTYIITALTEDPAA